MLFNLSIIVLTVLWIYSVFSFAHWRSRILSERNQFSGILNDFLFMAYYKVSGVVILSFFFFLLAR